MLLIQSNAGIVGSRAYVPAPAVTASTIRMPVLLTTPWRVATFSPAKVAFSCWKASSFCSAGFDDWNMFMFLDSVIEEGLLRLSRDGRIL